MSWLNCQFPEEDHIPEGGYAYTADSLATAKMVLTQRPLAHGGMGDGRFEFVTGHLARTVEAGCHRAYGEIVQRPDGSFTVVLCSQPGGADSAVWSEGVFYRQEGPDPDGIVPDGGFGVLVEHYQPYPVEVLYSSEYLLCGGVDI
jgi:hypothetical protein